MLNKIYSIRTISLVAKDLGEDEDFLHELCLGMEPEDGVIRVYDVLGEDSVLAFSDFGVDYLVDLIADFRLAEAGASSPPKS